MKRKIAAIMTILWTGIAEAQTSLPANDDAKQATIAADPGRPIPDDRGGLSGRGGADPTGSSKTYSATIGSAIYSTIGTPIGSSLPAHR